MFENTRRLLNGYDADRHLFGQFMQRADLGARRPFENDASQLLDNGLHKRRPRPYWEVWLLSGCHVQRPSVCVANEKSTHTPNRWPSAA